MKRYRKYFIIALAVIAFCVSICFIPFDASRFIPEVEIRYELFTKYAMDLVEENLDIKQILNMAREVEFNKIYSFNEIKEKVI